MTLINGSLFRLINFCLLSLFIGFSGFAQQKSLTIKNETSRDWKGHVAEIPWSEVTMGWKPDMAKLIVTASDGKQVPFQLETRGEGKVKNLLVLVSVKADASLKLVAMHVKYTAFPAKTFARYVPRCYEDFVWKNDVMAFRAYGKALESAQ
jgi:hypothetical protein